LLVGVTIYFLKENVVLLAFRTLLQATHRDADGFEIDGEEAKLLCYRIGWYERKKNGP
jgi:hypothetical protein